MRTRPRSLVNPPMNRRGLEPEKKNIDNSGITITSPASNAFSVPVPFCGVPLGPSPNERVGRKIRMKSLHIRGVSNLPATSNQNFRIIVVYDKQFNSFPVGGVTASDIMSQDIFSGFHNEGNQDRFITIVDQIFYPIDSDVNMRTTFNIYRKLNLESVYTGNAVNDISTGALLIMQADPTTAATSLTFTARMKFTDV